MEDRELAYLLIRLKGMKNEKRLHNLNILKEGITVARMGKKKRKKVVGVLFE